MRFRSWCINNCPVLFYGLHNIVLSRLAGRREVHLVNLKKNFCFVCIVKRSRSSDLSNELTLGTSAFSSYSHRGQSLVAAAFVLRDITSTTPDTDNRCPCWCRHSYYNDFCPWSGHLHWQWSLHENGRLQAALLCYADFAASAAWYQIQCLHGLAPSILAQSVRRVAELDRRRLRSSSSDDVIIPTTRLVTVGDCAFTAAGSRLWNSLPPDIRSAQTLSACFL